MGLGRLLSEARDLRRTVIDLLDDDRCAEEAARRELAASAQRFSDKTKRVVDDKLTFTAALMRAGEVDAASRLFAEVEADVCSEKAALIEHVNEVKVAADARRFSADKIRVARLLAIAVLGCVMMMGSALGFTVASLFENGEPSNELADTLRARGSQSATAARAAGADRKSMRVKIAPGVEVTFSRRELREYRTLMAGPADPDGLERFLYEVLGPKLAHKVQTVLTTATAAGDTVKQAAAPLVPPVVIETAKKSKKKEAHAARSSDQEQSQSSGETQAQPEPGSGGDQEPSPSPNPSPSSSDNNQAPGGEGGERGDGDANDGGGLTPLDGSAAH